jgi:hypothetical protein
MGKLIMESILETMATTILEFVAGLRGTLSVTFEEGTWAAWLYDLLKLTLTNWWCVIRGRTRCSKTATRVTGSMRANSPIACALMISSGWRRPDAAQLRADAKAGGGLAAE